MAKTYSLKDMIALVIRSAARNTDILSEGTADYYADDILRLSELESLGERRRRAEDDGPSYDVDDAARSVDIWRHARTGGEYEVLGTIPLQCSGDRALESVAWTLYTDRSTGQSYVRPREEFMDGRFEPVNEAARGAALAYKAERDAAVEVEARRVYELWASYPDYVPWVEGGNSMLQERSRDHARDNISLPYRLATSRAIAAVSR